jgi:uncharacterized phage protein (TIGR02216 family)
LIAADAAGQGIARICASICLTLRLPPETVWRMAFAEIRLIGEALRPPAAAMTRQSLQQVMARFPDTASARTS